GDRKMRSYISLFIFVILACLVSNGFAQQSGGSKEVDTSSFPYTAEITGNDVYVRSGPGTNFYHCGKLKAGDKLVAAEKIVFEEEDNSKAESDDKDKLQSEPKANSKPKTTTDNDKE
ncbi:hypothetical protein ACFL3Q_12045, partial [Planctomycetota bacterium]